MNTSSLETAKMPAQESARLSQSPWKLLAQAFGDPAHAAKKARRFFAAFAAYGDRAALKTRLERLHALGYLETIPNGVQIAVGALDMLRFWVVPASEDYYQQKGIDFRFHQLLRILDDPASLVDPIGLFSTPDTIIGHLMQVVHANPRYDLELLESWENGLEQLESEVVQMLAGTHPRAQTIGAIVEEPEYHARLLEYVRAYRRDHTAPAPLRQNIPTGRFAEIEKTFGSLPTAFRYFASLPDTVGGALRHLLKVKTFQPN
jgi:hypothetical protein